MRAGSIWLAGLTPFDTMALHLHVGVRHVTLVELQGAPCELNINTGKGIVYCKMANLTAATGSEMAEHVQGGLVSESATAEVGGGVPAGGVDNGDGTFSVTHEL
jgi:hypothetical protein